MERGRSGVQSNFSAAVSVTFLLLWQSSMTKTQLKGKVYFGLGFQRDKHPSMGQERHLMGVGERNWLVTLLPIPRRQSLRRGSIISSSCPAPSDIRPLTRLRLLMVLSHIYPQKHHEPEAGVSHSNHPSYSTQQVGDLKGWVCCGRPSLKANLPSTGDLSCAT